MGYDFEETRYCEANRIHTFGPDKKSGTYLHVHTWKEGYYKAFCKNGIWDYHQVTTPAYTVPVMPYQIRMSTNFGWNPWVPETDGPTGTDTTPTPEKSKCTCGTSITMGSQDHIDYHSDWCDLKNDKSTSEAK